MVYAEVLLTGNSRPMIVKRYTVYLEDFKN